MRRQLSVSLHRFAITRYCDFETYKTFEVRQTNKAPFLNSNQYSSVPSLPVSSEMRSENQNLPIFTIPMIAKDTLALYYRVYSECLLEILLVPTRVSAA